ncbi:DUF4372 domain-containing protein [Patiriisocius sp. Uisw_017]|uniref:DUF4372 domain-containing protein n=1 Tax=Patiriisocius sp. Uisw_017 TaxID=3230968 RepID=UPI0039EA22DE
MINITLFSQIISKLDNSKFKKLVKSHQSDKHQKLMTFCCVTTVNKSILVKY